MQTAAISGSLLTGSGPCRMLRRAERACHAEFIRVWNPGDLRSSLPPVGIIGWVLGAHVLQSSVGKVPTDFIAPAESKPSSAHDEVFGRTRMEHSQRDYKRHRLEYMMLSSQPTWIHDLRRVFSRSWKPGGGRQGTGASGLHASDRVTSFIVIPCF